MAKAKKYTIMLTEYDVDSDTDVTMPLDAVKELEGKDLEVVRVDLENGRVYLTPRTWYW